MARRLWWSAAWGLLIASGCAPASVTLVRDGQPRAAIFVAPRVMAADSKKRLKNPALEAQSPPPRPRPPRSSREATSGPTSMAWSPSRNSGSPRAGTGS